VFSNCNAKDAEVDKKVVVKGKGKPTLGVVLRNVDEERVKELKINGGAEIRKVIDESEADKIGLKKGDIITKFDGSDISEPDDLIDLVSDIEEEKTVEIVVNRDGKKMEFKATLDPENSKNYSVWWSDDDMIVDLDGFHSEHFNKYVPDVLGSGKGGFMGVEVENLSDQLLDYFEVEHGVLIEKVSEGSPAEKAGLKAGDIIMEVEGRKIEDYRDLVRTLNYYNPDEEVKVKYTRKGKENTTTVILGKKNKMKFKFMPGDVDVHSSFDWTEEFGDGMMEMEGKLKDLDNKMKKIDVKVVVI
jgi:serine protease Do